MNSHKAPLAQGGVSYKKIDNSEPGTNFKKSHCQSEYYLKTAETKTELDLNQLQDELKIKDGQL